MRQAVKRQVSSIDRWQIFVDCTQFHRSIGKGKSSGSLLIDRFLVVACFFFKLNCLSGVIINISSSSLFQLVFGTFCETPKQWISDCISTEFEFELSTCETIFILCISFYFVFTWTISTKMIVFFCAGILVEKPLG